MRSLSGAADRAPAAGDGAAHRERVALFLAGFAAFLSLYAPQAVLPQMAASLSASPAEAGSVIGATSLAVALAAPVAGPLADRFGRKRVMVVSLGLLVPLTLLLAACTTLAQVLAVRFAQGMVLPALFASATAYMNERWRGPDVASVTGFYVAGCAMGGAAGRLVAGLSAEGLGWQGSFAVLGLLSIAGAPLVHRWLPADLPLRREQLSAHVSALLGHLRNPRLLAAGLLGATLLFSMSGTLSYVGFRLAGPPFELTPGRVGLVFLVYPIGAAVVTRSGRLARRLGPRRALQLAIGISVAGELLLLVPDLAVTAAGVAVFVTGIFLSQSAALAAVGRAAPSGKGAAAGLYVCCFYAGGGLGSTLSGLAWQSAGWTGCIALVCAALAIGAAASLGTAR